MEAFHQWMNALKQPGWAYFQPVLQGQKLSMDEVKKLGAKGILLFESHAQTPLQIEAAKIADLQIGATLRTIEHIEAAYHWLPMLNIEEDWVVADVVALFATDSCTQQKASALLNQMLLDPHAHIGLDGGMYHIKGAGVVQELAAMLSALVTMINQGTLLDIEPGQLSKRLQISSQCGPLFFMEMAKLRALRMLIWNLFSIYDVAPFAFPVHVSTSMLYWSGKDVEMNLLRHTTEAASAVLGSTDRLSIMPFTADAADRSLAEKLSLDLNMLLAEEVQLNKFVDAPGGSFYIDELTDLIASHAWKLFQEVEEKGGIFTEEGKKYWKAALQTTTAQRLDMLQSGKLQLVGVNVFESQMAKTSVVFQEFENFSLLYQAV
jgi:methylmalonyl-CoA mutase N-terminal domain/subunit